MQLEVLYAFPYRNLQPGTYIYHKHEFLELSIMMAGFSDYNVEGQWRRVVAGQVLLFNPGIHHQETQPPNSQSLQLHIGIRQLALPGQLPDQLPLVDSLVSLGDWQAEFMAGAQRIIAETKRPNAFGHADMLQAQVTELLYLLIRALPANQVSDDYQNLPTKQADQAALVAAAAYYLRAHYQEDLTLGRLAETLHVSAAYLSRTFKAVRGTSPITYLTTLRLRQAQTLLQAGQLSVSEVAHSVGYQDPYYFSKLFKRHFGVAPSKLI